MRLSRLLLGAVAVTTCVVLVGVVAGARTGPQPDRDAADVRSLQPALAALHRWDAARARAWAGADVAALRSLYTAGSEAGEHDAAMLRRWRDRGLRVEGMQAQLLATRVAVRRADRMVLVVTDRVVGAVAAGRGHRVVLPTDQATTRRVTLRRVAGEWRMASVRPAARRPVARRSAQR
jgi:outer membrane murein-binding lipoprotein Lpp